MMTLQSPIPLLPFFRSERGDGEKGRGRKVSPSSLCRRRKASVIRLVLLPSSLSILSLPPFSHFSAIEFTEFEGKPGLFSHEKGFDLADSPFFLGVTHERGDSPLLYPPNLARERRGNLFSLLLNAREGIPEFS